MAEPFISEIKMYGFNWAPRQWALCDGQIMPISENTALYALIGTAYGGDGRTTFGLPELRGRVPMHTDFGAYPRGLKGGFENVTLVSSELPSHSHTVRATSEDAVRNAQYNDAFFAKSINDQDQSDEPAYRSATDLVEINSATVSSTGGGQSHSNLQPSAVICFCIALTGVFPSRD